MAQHRNRLSDARSPYLLQHASNPVDWHEWGPEAFERARREDKPVFLSIGYATCHWCHVMAHESFEDGEVARRMNEAFVNVKVDREERPDVDGVYMQACQLMTGSGGWPLTIVMTPDGRPFFAATYIPREARWGRMGMLELVPRIQALWKDERGRVLDSAAQLASALVAPDEPAGAPRPPGRALLDLAYTQLARAFDDEHGGFGSAPKFPTPHQLTFLLRDHVRTGNADPLRMVERTLDAMRAGGIWDHAGWGFHRYSTDAAWIVPHFEKMLYDQALLALAYVEAFQATGHARHADTARRIVGYVLRDLTSPEGAFFCAEDADSEGVEGRFYVWSEAELRDALDASDAAFAIRALDVRPKGNFVDEATHERSHANILHRAGPLPPQDERRLDRVLERLREVRAKRARPLLDDKVLADWNGLMIAAAARCGAVLGEPSFVEAATRAAAFVARRMTAPDGRLLHRWRDGEAAIPAFLDDHAFLAWGLVELYEATGDAAHLEAALGHADAIRARFDDPNGGFFTSADDAEQLVVRHKDVHDGALPSGNSVAAAVFWRLARMTGRDDLDAEAARTLAAAGARMEASPAAFTHALQTLGAAFSGGREIVVAGDPSDPATRALLDVVRGRLLLDAVLLHRSEATAARLTRLSPFTRGMGPIDGRPAAYVCRDHACQRPVTAPADLARLLDA